MPYGTGTRSISSAAAPDPSASRSGAPSLSTVSPGPSRTAPMATSPAMQCTPSVAPGSQGWESCPGPLSTRTLPVQRAADRLQHRSLAAEQVRATDDIEQQAVRRIERHQRREAAAPVGDGVQRRRVGGRIGIEHSDVRTDGARRRQRRPDVEAQPRGGIVQRRDHQRIVVLRDDDTGTVVRQGGFGKVRVTRCAAMMRHLVQHLARQFAPNAVGRQARQPQAEDAPAHQGTRRHGSGTHRNSIP